MLKDILSMSFGNLKRMKLRSFLTISGVVIGIGALVSMLSFGAGMQKNISDQYEQFGLLNTILVYPPKTLDESDSAKTVILNEDAIEALADLPGVRLAYPYDNFTVTVQFSDTIFECSAQTLPHSAMNTKMFSDYKSGGMFSSDSIKEVVVSDNFLENIGIYEPDSAIGKEVILSMKVTSIDSGIVSLVTNYTSKGYQIFRKFNLDSLNDASYRNRIATNELREAFKLFFDGFLNSNSEVRDTLKICGVIESWEGSRIKVKPIIIPVNTAANFSSSGFSSDPAKMLAAIKNGDLFDQNTDDSKKEFPQVTLDLDPSYSYETVRDSVEAMGFRYFSYIDNLQEIRKFFVYFNLALGVVGFIALTVAALGIVNIMVMSIIERYREIGILKSLGADEGKIKLIFLVESGAIGFIGSVFGIILGWIVTRICSIAAKYFIARQGGPEMEMFYLPLWLIVFALIFGIGISTLAGLFPAVRAAKVDPVKALRHD